MAGIVSGVMLVFLSAGEVSQDYPIRPVAFTDVGLADAFWRPRQETNRKVTIPYDFKRCEETGRIDNFAKAGRLMEGAFKGIRFDDSDVFKVVEGAAYSLAIHPDPELDAYLDALIVKIAAAQEPDGYLYTARTIDPAHPAGGAGPDRWTALEGSHELYNLGHLYEAAAAHYQATGKRTLLDVALKSANLVCNTFGPDKLRRVPGHQEIEIGLVKLYRITGEKKYLDMAKFFLDERGHANGRELYGEVLQDHLPVLEQREAVGHAVRAGYMYSGMADVATFTGDPSYIQAIDRIWNDVVGRKLYITGGIGATRRGEAFGAPYELPNKAAYNETCAAIANILWNYRMFLLHGEARYVDVLERTLYNGFLAGVGLSGDRFFYPNPLECDGVYAFNHGSLERQPWFDCACCPVNVARFVASLGGYVYAQKDKRLFVNLYVGSTGKFSGPDGLITLTQQTRYPWEGRVTLNVALDKAVEFELALRVPGWAQGAPVPSDLYRYLDPSTPAVTLKVNGADAPLTIENGYAVLARKWQQGDTVELTLPMPIRRVLANDQVKDDIGRVALERGPIVFCVEGADNASHVLHLALPDEAALTAEERPDLLGGLTVVHASALAKMRTVAGETQVIPAELEAIPYYAWDHRGAGEMAVWLPRDAALAEAAPVPTLASTSHPSASHVWQNDSLRALNDLVEPKSSNDQEIPRFTWWDHRGTTEWVQYEFTAPKRIAGVEVYWFDDRDQGQCRIPNDWHVLYRAGTEWRPVTHPKYDRIKRDVFNTMTFDALETDAIRLDVELQKEFSAGILEWRVIEAAN